MGRLRKGMKWSQIPVIDDTTCQFNKETITDTKVYTAECTGYSELTVVVDVEGDTDNVEIYAIIYEGAHT